MMLQSDTHPHRGPSPARSRRVPAALAGVALCLLIAPPSALSQPAGRTWTVAPPPSWVRTQALPAADTPLRAAADSGRLYLLVDHQVRVGAPTTDYRRYAWTALSTAGVQNASEIQLRFDPSFERLVIHHVRLLRGGKDVFSFRPSDVRVIQQERSLDEQIYSGELTAVVFLRDLRPGDTLDYAYSLEGANPIVGDGFDDELPLAYDAPVRLVRHVIHVPSRTTLNVTPRNTSAAPLVETSGGWRSYTWTASDVPASVADEDEPGWFDPDPRIEVSTFGSWAEVADWARGLFEDQLRPSPGVRQLADRCRAVPGGARAAALEATRFVQDEVRYLGIEMGPSSHQPHPPDQVLRQRFGDCKDKSLLLVALLRELGIEAVPALVDTERRHGLDTAQPSPFAFDHAIVQAVVDGRTIWIDATESDMGGALEDRDPPEFERALVLRPGTRGLTAIPVPDTREPSIVLRETFTVGRPGSPARLDAVTTFRRTEADGMRSHLASTPAQELAKSYLEDYAPDFPDITAIGAPVVRDDRARNVLTVSESYELASFWKNGRRDLHGWEIENHLPTRVAATRATPLAVPHPVHVRHEIVLRANSAFHLGRYGETIADRAFTFNAALSASGKEMRLAFDYRSLADAVLSEDMKAHTQAIERLEDALSFVVSSDLTSPDAPEDGWSGSTRVGAAGALALAAVLAVAAGIRIRRRRQRGSGLASGAS